MSRYATRHEDEPLTIDADCVAEWLRDRGKDRMASFVQALGHSCQMANQRERHAYEQAEELRKRLEVYEPQQRHQQRDPTPPPEASD